MPECEIVVMVEGGRTPLADTWVYMAEGDAVTTWRTTPEGALRKRPPGGDDKAATQPWKYDAKLTLDVPKKARFYTSRGARPIPETILKERVFANAHAWVERTVALPAEGTHAVAPGETSVIAVKLAEVALPPVEVALTQPTELSILPLLWDHAPEHATDGDADYVRAGLPQKTEAPGHGATPTAPPAAVQPKERGVTLKGTLDTRARHVRIQLLDPSGNVIQVRETATASPTSDRVVATTASGGLRAFSVDLWVHKPTKAFGALQVVVESADDDEERHLVGVFFLVLVGMQIALVDDTAVQADGTATGTDGKLPGPFVGQAGERVVRDYSASPVRDAASSDLFLSAQRSLVTARKAVKKKNKDLGKVQRVFAEEKPPLDATKAALVKAVAAATLPLAKTTLLATKTALAKARAKEEGANALAPKIAEARETLALDLIGDATFDASGPPFTAAVTAVNALFEPATTTAAEALALALTRAGVAVDLALTKLDLEIAATVETARAAIHVERAAATTAATTALNEAEIARAAGAAATKSATDQLGNPAGVEAALTPGDHRRDELRAIAKQKANEALCAVRRTRRMVSYPLRADRVRKLDGTGAEIIHPEMPMWMAELHLFGLDQPVLEDLLARRKRQLAGKPTSLALSVDWQLNFRWNGPDHDDGGYSLDKAVHGIWTATGLQRVVQEVTLAINDSDALTLDGDAVKDAFKIVPVALQFPVTTRRAPVVAIANRSRPWGRATPTDTLHALVVEWQVPVLDSAGKETMYGGDGELKISALQVGGSAIALGVPASEHAAMTPVLKLVQFRVPGTNPVGWTTASPPSVASTDALSTALDVIIDDAYTKLAAGAAARVVDVIGWKLMARRIFYWESGKRGEQFGSRWFEDFEFTARFAWSYGHQPGTPLFGYPHGYTIPQVDPHPKDNAMWSFVEGIRAGLAVAFGKAEGARAMMVSQHQFDPEDRRHKEILLRDTVRRYNTGGPEFTWGHPATYHAPTDGTPPDPEDWVINPSVMSNPTYPNDVLDTHVNYNQPLPIEFASNSYVLSAAAPPAPPAAAPPAPPAATP